MRTKPSTVWFALITDLTAPGAQHPHPGAGIELTRTTVPRRTPRPAPGPPLPKIPKHNPPSPQQTPARCPEIVTARECGQRRFAANRITRRTGIGEQQAFAALADIDRTPVEKIPHRVTRRLPLPASGRETERVGSFCLARNGARNFGLRRSFRPDRTQRADPQAIARGETASVPGSPAPKCHRHFLCRRHRKFQGHSMFRLPKDRRAISGLVRELSPATPDRFCQTCQSALPQATNLQSLLNNPHNLGRRDPNSRLNEPTAPPGPNPTPPMRVSPGCRGGWFSPTGHSSGPSAQPDVWSITVQMFYRD